MMAGAFRVAVVICGKIRAAADARRLLDMGVDGIMTDRPELLA